MLETATNTAKEQILVVDDEPMICKSCKEILEEEGYRVDLAYSGQEGINKALAKAFDLVIVDLKMPDLSGMALLKRIKGENLKTPVIMITAFSTVETAIEAMKMGASDYIPKPFTPEELSDVVSTVITKKEAVEERFPVGHVIGRETVMKVLDKQKPQVQYTVTVDVDKCIGCQMCMMDCAAHHADPKDSPIVYPQAWKLISESRMFVDLEGPLCDRLSHRRDSDRRALRIQDFKQGFVYRLPVLFADLPVWPDLDGSRRQSGPEVRYVYPEIPGGAGTRLCSGLPSWCPLAETDRRGDYGGEKKDSRTGH